jgi:hypothetical protein
MAKKGLFDLTDFEESGTDDILKLNLFGEGADETPTAKPKDAASIPVPKGTAITADTYNSALSALKKSFKEGAEILEMLETATIIEENVDQDAYTEAVVYDAMVESYYEGPVFEAAQKENKDEIKGIAKKVRKELCKFTRSVKAIFKKITTGERLGLLDPFIFDKLSGDLKLYSWQTVCMLYPARGTTMGKVMSGLNEEFASALGEDYELKAIKMNFILGALGKMEEISEEDKASTRKLTKIYLLIVDEKKAKSPEEVEVKINKSDLAKLLKAQQGEGEEKNKTEDKK